VSSETEIPGAFGLSSAQAAERLVLVGRNEIRRPGRLSVWSSIGAQLRDPLIVVLLAASVLTVATGDFVDAAVIAIVIVANSTVGVTQELRADRAVTALSQLTAPTVRVRRDGNETMVDSATLVPGDIVLLGEGDVVPADAAVLEAAVFMVDESAISGESVAALKGGADREGSGDTVFAGTIVVKGRAVIVVTNTGAKSALGRIAELMDSRAKATPLQRRLAGLGRVLAAVAIALSAAVLAVGLARGEPTELMIVIAISLAVAAIPESLPAVVTLSLALGARRMANRKAIVRRLPAVETLGSVTILATDKTGTLTQGRMVVVEAWTPYRSVTFIGEGYEPAGELFEADRHLDLDQASDVVELLTAAALCNDATLVAPVSEDDLWSGLGDPTEVALLAAAGKVGLNRVDLERRLPRLLEIPFESTAQRMTTVHADGLRYRVTTKGSPEAMVALPGVHGEGADPATILRRASELAAHGYRVLAVCSGPSDTPKAVDVERDLHFLGLLAIADPPKPAASRTVSACRAAGITPVLITGDHPATARAIAEQVGILDQSEGIVVTGEQIRDGQVPDLTAARVFARTSPEQKLDIIQAWRARGEVVAMTGDGVNDGPALRQSDIGVAMGRRGTEVARQAADLVLADDELATVVVAVEEGRRVYGNIRRFLIFGLAGGAAAIAVMLLGPLVGLAVPLLASQILWINLLTHGLTGVAMGAEPGEPGAMNRPPQPPAQSVLGDGLWQRVLRIGVVITAVALTVGVWGRHTDRGWQSMLFLALTSLELGVAMGLRSKVWTRQNLYLPAAVTGSLLLALAGLYVPVLRDLLGTVSLPVSDAALATAVGSLGWVAARVDQRLFGHVRGSDVRPIILAGTVGRGTGDRSAC
jgi:Ca2+-transporting ATPase